MEGACSSSKTPVWECQALFVLTQYQEGSCGPLKEPPGPHHTGCECKGCPWSSKRDQTKVWSPTCQASRHRWPRRVSASEEFLCAFRPLGLLSQNPREAQSPRIWKIWKGEAGWCYVLHVPTAYPTHTYPGGAVTNEIPRLPSSLRPLWLWPHRPNFLEASLILLDFCFNIK